MKVFWRLLGLMKPHRGMMALSILLAAVATLANIGLMAVSGWFIAGMGLAGVAGAAINYFTPAAVIRAFAIMRTAGRYGERVISHEATFRVLAGLKRWFYDAIEPLAPAGLGAQSSGDLLARIRGDIERLELVFLRILSPIVVAVFAVLVVASVTIWYLPAAGFVLVALLVAGGVALPLWAARAGADASRKITTLSATMKDDVVDGLEGLGDLQLAGRDDAFRADIGRLTETYIGEEARLARVQGLSTAGIGLAANLALFTVLLLAIPSVRAGSLMPAELPMLMLLAVASFDAVAPLPLAFQTLAGTLASARRLFELADREPVVREAEKPAPLPQRHDLVFEDVSFRYRPSQLFVVAGIDIDLSEGRRIAIVGESGSGKSSLISLAVRFWDPAAGKITLGGTDIAQLSFTDLRARIAVQAQSPHLFAATIRDNLLIARPDANDGQIEAAARAADIHDFIMSLPKGYDTFVGAHGHLLSGGEGRRIAIAQALLKDTPILMLDEPTEGLDVATAQRMLGRVLDAAHGRSVVLVTHNAIGLEAMDEIIVLAAGRIAARGDFATLTAPGAALSPLVSMLET